MPWRVRFIRIIALRWCAEAERAGLSDGTKAAKQAATRAPATPARVWPKPPAVWVAFAKRFCWSTPRPWLTLNGTPVGQPQPDAKPADAALEAQAVRGGLLAQTRLELLGRLGELRLSQRRGLRELGLCQREIKPGGRLGAAHALGQLPALLAFMGWRRRSAGLNAA